MFFFVLSEKQTLDAMYEHISQLVKYLPIDISIKNVPIVSSIYTK